MAVVLLYHRITALARDPQLLTVAPAHFGQHVRILHESFDVVRLSDLAAGIRAAGKAAERAVAITFDDGYRDNLLKAAPILRSTGTPATIFSTAGRDPSAGEFFWDELERIFLSPGRLPHRLQVAAGPFRMDADLGPSTDYSPEEAEAHEDWDVLRADDPTPRHRVYREACARLHSLCIADRAGALEAIRHWAGMEARVRESHRMMDPDELRDVTRDSLIEIGGHTVDHPRLSSEGAGTQRGQIVSNRHAIASATGSAPRGFAYPFGTRRDYTAETAALLGACGFEFACSNFVGRVDANTDPYQIPRYIVRNWTGEEFERRLRAWLQG